MLFEIEEWARYAQKQRRFTRNNSFFGDPLITHKVSKHFKGGSKNDRVRTICESPVACAHLHFPGSFDCNSLESSECDSAYSRKHVGGQMKAGYHATFGDDEAERRLEAHEQRGFFFGGFVLERRDRKVVQGVMDGNCNIGIVRDPLEKAVEKCHHVGRWYGRIHAGVNLPDDEKGFLSANVAIDVKYEDNTSYLATEFVGTLEGMLIRECKREEKG